MSVRLEPIYLANVLLFDKDVATIKAFPLVSKNCQVASLALKLNPAVFSTSPRSILRRFPPSTRQSSTSSRSSKRLAHPDTLIVCVQLSIKRSHQYDPVFERQMGNKQTSIMLADKSTDSTGSGLSFQKTSAGQCHEGASEDRKHNSHNGTTTDHHFERDETSMDVGFLVLN